MKKKAPSGTHKARPKKPRPQSLQRKATTKRADSRDWRAGTLAQVRAIIQQADPELVEEVKWRKPSNSMRGVPVWSHPRSGMICTGETYKSAVKLTFARGAALEDPSGLFSASMDGGTRRAIDIHEGDTIDAKALKALVREAVALGASTPRAAGSGGASKKPGATTRSKQTTKTKKA